MEEARMPAEWVAESTDPRVERIRFNGILRPSQVDANAAIVRDLAKGSRHLHIVAPPGSGKTILGLHTWANVIQRPALVLSPNSAIQAQWAARTSLFDLAGQDDQISIDPKQPGLLTSLTYQSVTLPKQRDEDLDGMALELWTAKLIADGEAADPVEAKAWQKDLAQRNPNYHESRLSTYRKQARDAHAMHGNALWTLHDSAQRNLERLKDAEVGLIILDECHHLLGHWGRVLSEVRDYFGDPIVLGLTATPPDRQGKPREDVERYDEFFGGIDYEVPVPALVREGNLSPYQDLAWFVRPTPSELEYIAGVDDEFEAVLLELRDDPEVDPPEPKSNGDSQGSSEKRARGLDRWVRETLGALRLPIGELDSWRKFVQRDERFANAGRLYLASLGEAMPSGVPPIEEALREEEWPRMAILMPVLDRYIRHGLRRSDSTDDHALAEDAIAKLRMLGVQITETGARACASPVGRVMAYAEAKMEALTSILSAEMQSLGSDIRAVVVTDFEKTSATAAVEGVLDDEAGGAVAAFRVLVADEACDRLDPVLATGSTVLIDDDIVETFLTFARGWLEQRGYDVKLTDTPRDRYHHIRGRGGDWCPRVYIELITEMLQTGMTRCLVGTRGLLGEGWDASKVNVLVDLTTVTTSMSVNQLRGRSMRLDRDRPEKIANNWDIVCLAEEFTKGFDDYHRFRSRHDTLYGVCDDGAIEKGVGHVHAAFTEARPEGISEAMEVFNADMIRRARNRQRARELWKIGEPFHLEPQAAIEVSYGGSGMGMSFSPLIPRNVEWNDSSLTLAIGRSVLGALRECGVIEANTDVDVGTRDGGWVRAHLKEASEEDSRLFATALQDVLGPLRKPRYVIPRSVRKLNDTWLSSMLPEVLAQYLRKADVETVMLHMVPIELARNKERAEVFERHWNLHVSPGSAVYARNEEGEALVREMEATGMTPDTSMHRKDVFL